MPNVMRIKLVSITEAPLPTAFINPFKIITWFSHDVGDNYIISTVSVNSSFASYFSMSNLFISQSYVL